MEKLTIDFETFNKMKEIAHEAVDDSLKKLFTIKNKEGAEVPVINSDYVEDKDSLLSLFNTKLKGYNYKYGNSPLNIDTDFNYPFTIYYDTNNKVWWLDLHNLSKTHASYSKIVNDMYNGIKLIRESKWITH